MRKIRTNDVTFSLQENSNSLKIFFNEIKKFKTLSKEEEINLINNWQKNKDTLSKDKVLNSNLRFVVSVAKKYVSNSSVIELEDLINNGVIGMTKAIDVFDTTKDYKFITFAVFHIQKEILSFIYKNKTSLKIPSQLNALHNKIKNFIDNEIEQNGVQPDKDFLIEKFNLSENSYNFIISNYEEKSIHSDELIYDDKGENSISLHIHDNQEEDKKSKELFEKANELCEKILNKREKKLFELLYNNDKAEFLRDELKYSDSRLIQIKKSIHDKLKENINNLKYK